MSEVKPPTSCAPCCGAHDHGLPAGAAHPGSETPSSAGHDAPLPKGLVRQTYRVPSMDCMAEESDIRRALDPIKAVQELRFHLGSRTLTVTAQKDALPAVVRAIQRAGYASEPVDAHAGEQGHDHPHSHGHDHGHDHSTTGLPRLVLALLLALGAEVLHLLPDPFAGSTYAGMGLAVMAIALSGSATYRKGLAALRHGRLNINALMTVAVTGAFVLGEWPEAAMVMALYAIAELIEARSVDRARHAIAGLLAMAPQEAEVQQADGQWQMRPVSTIAVGEVVRVRPGQRVPVDGMVQDGHSAIDQSAVTGESLPAEKSPGDGVYAGTLNHQGELSVRVNAAAGHSTLDRIIEAVEKAQGSRAPTQRFVDRFAAVYTPAVFVLAAAVALLAPWLLDWTWTEGAYKALVLLVIACPCALVIATPVTVVSALARAARHGILIKGGVYLEQARTVRAVALDKTGTLTTGRPTLSAFEPLALDRSPEELAALAWALAERSDHPVSRAIAQGLFPDVRGLRPEVSAFTALLGRGVQGQLDGAAHVLGNHRLIDERGQGHPALQARMSLHESQGRTVSVLADDQGPLALFAVADTLKASTVEAVRDLQGLGVHTVMLTGDNTATAQAIAAQAGIGDHRGELLPQDKQAAITSLQRAHGVVAMVGDGINDAPALAQADIGVAMGGAGTDIAIESADVVIMNDDLRRLSATIRLSRRTHAVLWQNIVLALGIKAVFLVLALAGEASMWMAVFADMGASLLVVANGLRMLRVRL